MPKFAKKFAKNDKICQNICQAGFNIPANNNILYGKKLIKRLNYTLNLCRTSILTHKLYGVGRFRHIQSCKEENTSWVGLNADLHWPVKVQHNLLWTSHPIPLPYQV